ncbi:hypothetical protein U5922_017265 [Aquicoccus sp. G2-2]|uniref:hypothetical protein n=1 Tax=Aquicoccus sp. G2-2 TaxID=3092120 RepID=UPI002ADF4393|nr:hypothetical protein [Aquicoccus sp. G2-2]MEA1115133.1 hypothetical protein [Aquicoccus sp. G2-2]
MKLAIATFATALITATAASAMVTEYDRNIDNLAVSGELMSGQQKTVDVSTQPTSPASEWRANGEKSVTVFNAGTQDGAGTLYQGR